MTWCHSFLSIPKQALSSYILFLCIALAHGVTFNGLQPGIVTNITISEDTTGGIYPLDANDPLGNVHVFSILSQTPSTPAFTISSSDELTVPSQGLDAETTTEFNFTFSVTSGSNTATSGLLTLRVTDVNDNDPVFLNTPYTGEVWKNDPAGTFITIVTSRDPDISNLPVTYSLSGSQTTFTVDNSGVISLSDAAGLASLPHFITLLVVASDGARTGTAAVTITVHSSAHGVIFNKPPRGRVANLTIPEDTTGGIYPLDANDPYGNVPVFSILSQTPSTPVFTISSTDELTVPSVGLDAETTTEFNFTFRVTTGSHTTTSGLLTLRVTDVNDNDPVFLNAPYTGQVWKNDPAGTVITTVSAIDPDISNLPVTFSISGSQTTFTVDQSGVISVRNTAGLASLYSPTVLQVQASDGGRTGYAAVTITVHDDPCSSGPCQNGGTCNSIRNTYNCICLSGYMGVHCQRVDYCYMIPCKNGGTCISKSTIYSCKCSHSYFGQNCTEPSANGLTFSYPPPGRVTNITISEDTTGGIYPLDAIDPSGNVPIFSILSQTPSTPAFTISSSDELTVPGQGLDAETTTEFNFTFSVTAGSNTATSGILTLRVADVNDNDPAFLNTPYTGEVWKRDPAGNVITTVSATDPDISNLPVTFSISGSQTTFTVDQSGVISVSNTAGLASLSSPTVLQVQASDGRRIGSAAVTITVHDDPCSSGPCQNGGTCYSDRGNYSCTCLQGYHGNNCGYVLRVEDTIKVSCSEFGWDIKLDMKLLNLIHPNTVASNIYLGDNSCTGYQLTNGLVHYSYSLRQCATSELVRNQAVIYTNQLIYAQHDRVHPFIIRHFNWTVAVECDLQKNETAHAQKHQDYQNNTSHNVNVASSFGVHLAFYKDPNFSQQMLGNPLHVTVGSDVYVKVTTNISDWSVKMRVHTCYTKPSVDADNPKYFLLKNGCEVDANTHIVSQSAHETTFVFQEFLFANNHEGLYVFCDANFCSNHDYSRQCTQMCYFENY